MKADPAPNDKIKETKSKVNTKFMEKLVERRLWHDATDKVSLAVAQLVGEGENSGTARHNVTNMSL